MSSSKIKILVAEPVSDLGGVSQYILGLIRYLPKERYEIHMAASGQGPLFEVLRGMNVTGHSLRIDYRWWSFLVSVVTVRRFLKKEQFQVLHFHTARAGFLMCVAGFGVRSAFLYTGHGWRFLQKRFSLERLLYYAFERCIARCASYTTLVGVSEYRVGLREALLQKEKSAVVPMSLDVHRFTVPPEVVEATRAKLRIPQGAFVVGMMGRITFQKYPQVFVSVAARVRKTVPHAYFLWIGDGELRGEMLGRARKENLLPRLIVTGQRKSEEIPALLGVLDLFLFTSRFEGLPVSLLEAMAARKFIVASEVGGVPDLIRDGTTGRLFPCGRTRLAALYIEQAARPAYRESYDALRQSAYEFILKNYTPAEKMSRTFDHIYERLVTS